MKRASTPIQSDSYPERWVIIRCFNRSGKINGYVRELYDRWKEMSHLGRLRYLARLVHFRVPYSYEWALEDGTLDGPGLPKDETFKPQNFTDPITRRILPAKKVRREGNQRHRVKSILAVGFDREGMHLCEMTMTYDKWAAMDYDSRLWTLSNTATHPVAYFQWRYVE